MPPSLPADPGILIPRGVLLPPYGIWPAGGNIGDILELVDDGFGNPVAQFTEPVNRIVGLTFTFGDGVNTPYAGSIVQIPMPFGMTMEFWRSRLDISGDAVFAVSVASTITGAYSGVGGTAPSVSGALGAEDMNGLDWTTTVLTQTSVVKVELVSFTNAKQITLVIGGTKTKPGP